MKVTRTHLIAACVAAALVLIGGVAYWLFSGSDVKDEVTTALEAGTCKPIDTVSVTQDDFTFGKADAPITLVEYASQTCSHCAAFHVEVFPKIDATYIKPGLVRFVFREFQRNRIDLAASLIGRCLGRDASMPFTDSLLENQGLWMGREDQNVAAGLKDMALRAGLSSDAFDACLKNEGEVTRLLAVKDKATKDYCLEGTPTLILNGKKLEPAASAFETLDGLLRAELKKKGIAAPADRGTPAPN